MTATLHLILQNWVKKVFFLFTVKQLTDFRISQITEITPLLIMIYPTDAPVIRPCPKDVVWWQTLLIRCVASDRNVTSTQLADSRQGSSSPAYPPVPSLAAVWYPHPTPC